ncbi:MAG: D-2-hydroxyacid dehydrogenase [Algisphaera sp.]
MTPTRPRLVVLDGYTTTAAQVGAAPNLGEPGWDALCALADVTVHDRTTADQIRERAADADLLITNKTVLDAAVLGDLPNLRYVGLLSTGTNAVDLEAAKKQGVVVCNAPAYSTLSVAQHAFALLLQLTNNVAEHAAEVNAGQWANAKDFCFTRGPLHELDGRTLGIVGFGDIGQAVARIGAAMGMRLLVHSRTQKPTDLNITWVNKKTLLKDSDVISLHCPLTPKTEQFVDAAALQAMKPTAYLINTGRGPLIDESALAKALQNGQLAGAGLDVLSAEPPASNHPLVGVANCIITPHVAWATQAARQRLMAVVAGNVEAFLANTPRNQVN